MKSEKRTAPRKRAPETGTPVMVRLQPELLSKVDEWRRWEADLPSRAEAIRRILEQGLVKSPNRDIVKKSGR